MNKYAVNSRNARQCFKNTCIDYISLSVALISSNQLNMLSNSEIGDPITYGCHLQPNKLLRQSVYCSVDRFVFIYQKSTYFML